MFESTIVRGLIWAAAGCGFTWLMTTAGSAVVLFTGKETPPEIDSDRGHDLAHPVSAVGLSHLKAHPLLACSRKIPKLYYFIFSGMEKESGADLVFGSTARGTSHPAPGEDAGTGTL